MRTEKCIKASKDMYNVLARYTSSEASTIVRTVTGLDGVEAWSILHANYSRGMMGRMFRVPRECVYSKPAKDVSQVRLASGKPLCLNSRRSDDSTLAEDVGSVSPKGRAGADADETG